MFYTTLIKIREHYPCREGWKTLLNSLVKTEADDEPLSFKTILESNGINDAIWALKTIDAPEVILFGVRCVRQIQHLLTDERSLHVLDVAEAFVVGEAIEEEFLAATFAAWKAAWDATEPVAKIASRAAVDAAEGSVWDAAMNVVNVVEDGFGAMFAARDVARDIQEKDFLAIFCSEEE